MADGVFVDTNVLVYAMDDAEPRKRDVARALLARLARESHAVTVSTQVLQELYVALTRGPHPIATPRAAHDAVRDAARFSVVTVDVPLVLDAASASQAHRIAFWDALVVVAARRAGCAVLYSEDLSDGQRYGSVRVESPFRRRAG